MSLKTLAPESRQVPSTTTAFVFADDDLHIRREVTIEAVNEKDAHSASWNLLTDQEKDACGCWSCVDEISNAQISTNLILTKKAYEAIHPDYRSVWTTERTDWAGWDMLRGQYIGKRTLMRNSCLYVEGMGLTITN